MEQPFEWTCQRPGCKRFLMGWTEKGLQMEIDRHMEQHLRDDIRSGAMSAILAKYKRPNYETLLVNRTDVGFLRTRHIKIDDDIVIDETLKYQASRDMLSPQLWAKILDTAWTRGEINAGIESTE